MTEKGGGKQIFSKRSSQTINQFLIPFLNHFQLHYELKHLEELERNESKQIEGNDRVIFLTTLKNICIA